MEVLRGNVKGTLEKNPMGKSSMFNEHQWSFWSFENGLHSLIKLHWFQGYERDPLSHPAATDQQIDWSSLAAVGLAAAGAVAFTQGSHD